MMLVHSLVAAAAVAHSLAVCLVGIYTIQFERQGVPLLICDINTTVDCSAAVAAAAAAALHLVVVVVAVAALVLVLVVVVVVAAVAALLAVLLAAAAAADIGYSLEII